MMHLHVQAPASKYRHGFYIFDKVTARIRLCEPLTSKAGRQPEQPGQPARLAYQAFGQLGQTPPLALRSALPLISLPGQARDPCIQALRMPEALALQALPGEVTEMCSGSEEGLQSRPINVCITQLYA